ncbi:putative RNA polymerase sigma factor [Actinacidiphila reveromycinica]|uniref:Putative RNA polymerase sigma factor n=1 Tax=Actinacidiphila reveromycinica TaxID=659352 RepID=A0A7U3VNT8_9ACTN|nr:RNA polymerase sigma-70 factor [Streptomyces sp. SN-593]BBA98022.1 putative RNA polymerase sigma factor [Streptomyces sp. SN-593]
MTSGSAEEFTEYRRRMFGLAYRLLGSAEEAEDAVQDAYLRWSRADRAAIEQPGAWLAKVVTNLCVNRLTSARARRERYVGPWLPEPVLTREGALGPLESAEQRDAVSTALLVLLERLNPTERAVYVLREAFGYSHRDIAGVLDLTEANSRQVYGRAVKRVAARETRFTPAVERQRALVESFVSAAREGDLARLERLLAEDVAWWSDGGGKASAARRPILGRVRVMRFLSGTVGKLGGVPGDVLAVRVIEANGSPAVAVWLGGRLYAVVGMDVRGDAIAGVWAVLNPEKLAFAARQLAEAA